MFGIGKKRAQDGEKTLREMTLGKACRIMEVELPRGGNAADADTRIGMVYGHPALCKKDSIVICSILGKQEEHCREALGKGASLVIVRQAAKMKFFADNARVVGRDDLFECLSRYERFVRSLFPAKAITITGSVGKTTTTEMIKTVFGDAFRLHASPSVLNSMGGALRIVQTLHNDDEFYLQELGAADTGYIVPSAKGLTPDAVVITNIGEAHLDGYGSRENILKDKASLVENMAEGGVAFFDKDDEMLRSYQTQRRIVFYALNDKTADYYAENIAAADGGQSFEIVERRTGKRFGAHIGLLGDYNVRNALAVFAMGTHFGIPAEKIIRSLDAYRPSGIRQNIRNIGGHTLFLDTFNSAPNTLIGSVQVMSSLPIRPGGRRILVAGDIAHLGKDAESIHYRVGTELARESFDLLITFGSLAANIYRGAVDAGFPHALCFGEEEREKLNDWLRDNISDKDITLYKGCQAINLSMTVDAVYGTTCYHGNEFVYESDEEMMLDGVRVCYNNVGLYRQFKKLLDKNAKKLVIPDDGKIRRIARDACRESKLESVEIPDRVVNIGQAAFYSCYRLTEVKLPQGLLYIEPSAFNSCVRLPSIVLPENTRHIEKWAFRDCYELRSITIPPRVGYIAPDAFLNCAKLTISGKAGSCAESYAFEHGIPFRAI